MSLHKSIFTIGFLTVLSRIMGYVRDMFIAATMGAGPLTDAFLVAFRLPNFFRRLFAEGAFSASFVPLFSGIYTDQGKEKAVEFMEKTLSMMAIGLLIFTIIFQIFMPLIMYVLAPGFVHDAEQFDLAVYLTRLTFPYLLFISIVSMFGGALNSLGKFSAAAASPILLNICLILSLYLLRSVTPTPAHALAWGVALAGVVQVIFLYLSLRKHGINLRLKKPELSPEVKKLLKLMLPGTIGAGIVQINLWVDTIIATLVPNAVSYLYYSDRINQLPLAVIGTAVGTALLPLLTRQIKEKKLEEAMATQNRALEISMFFTLPAAAAFMIIAFPIVSVLFQRGEFTGDEAMATAYSLSAYAIGLPAFVLIKLLVAPFFATHDTKTPVQISVVGLIANIVFNIILVLFLRHIGFFPHIGIALSTSLAAWLNVAMLLITLHKRNLFRADATLKIRLRGMILSSMVMSAALFIIGKFTGNLVSHLQFLAAFHLQEAAVLGITIACGLAIFIISAFVFKAFDLKIVLRVLKRGRVKVNS